MQQSLSPKRYIETKARSLPIYKCYVNPDWKESRMASVIVMRQHVNGNITAGLFLVDLLCLGIKDTFYLFNVSHDEILERFNGLNFFTEIDYNLAHNIIYAGHDFAMDFDIHPHKEFATTRFILEEDTDDIPLVDIPVGEKDGKPHLMVNEFNRFPEALAKLKKNAGEGNYYYTIGMHPVVDDDYEDDEEDEEEYDEDEEDEYEDDEEEEEELYLDEIPHGKLNLETVQLLYNEEVLDLEKVEQRTEFEQILLRTEFFVRTLPDELDELTFEEQERWDEEWNLLAESAPLPTGISQEQFDESERLLTGIFESLRFRGNGEVENAAAQMEEKMKKALESNSTNPALVAEVYEVSTFLFLDESMNAAKANAEKFYDKYPSLQLSLALGSLINEDKMDPRLESIYREKDIRKALPGQDKYFSYEVLNFWLLRLWMCLEENNLKDAIQYLFLVREAKVDVHFLLPVLIRLNGELTNYYGVHVLNKKLNDDDEETDANHANDAHDDNDDDDNTRSPEQNNGGKVVPF